MISRRLGVSLGVDLVVHKTCSMDCLYCECGKTTHLTCRRNEYVAFEDVKAELTHYFTHQPDPDYITFSGSGEPTLNSAIGKVIDFIKEEKPAVKVAVLTNSTLLPDPEVRRELLKADLVAPSLDAALKAPFERINRPDNCVTLESTTMALELFRKEYTGQIWLEVLLLDGVNDDAANLNALEKAVNRIQPDLIQINTLDRPGTIKDIRPVAREKLEQIAKRFNAFNVQIIARHETNVKKGAKQKDAGDMILQTLQRRPCTRVELEKITGLSPKETAKWIQLFEKEKKVAGICQENGTFYHTINKDDA